MEWVKDRVAYVDRVRYKRAETSSCSARVRSVVLLPLLPVLIYTAISASAQPSPSWLPQTSHPLHVLVMQVITSD
jgi:hypothetical protein